MGVVKGKDLVNEIDSLKLSDFKKIAKNLFSQKLNVVLEGNNLEEIDNFETLKKKFKF